MPNKRRSRATRRVDLVPRLRALPLIALGLLAVAVAGRSPSPEAPLRWTVRDAGAWMADFDGLRHERTALAIAARVNLAAAEPRPSTAAMVMAEADLVPRDVRKVVPIDAVEPEYTGAVPPGARAAPKPTPEVPPQINRTGKGDRLIAPQPLGRSTDRDLFVKPSLAAVPPSLDGWPPLVTVASLAAPLNERTLPRRALAAPDAKAADDRVIVAMVRTGPGRVVTQSAIAALGNRPGTKGRPILPPMPDAQMAAANPRTEIMAQPKVPEIGYARRAAAEVLARFRAVLGDEDDATTPPATAPN
ncbi:hypothetical protein EYW49_18400 [Siculibacillus lacustris]|uniref:Uncharacterized protein n=1 Tax=Siculibacillus lacustris TaxID=1549641 RepID=A0A4Q9VH58_9HYPH|nr:hypothetical protein [Siculibacillus lacustris]TBW34410.1 hypothetical protein EYW49_18400 [Siculibacillus lacustris]